MGSSGGGTSGAVSHSAYLETIHQDWLNDTGTDVISSSITAVMNSAIGGSPWTGLTAYDPAIPIADYEAVLVAYKAILAGIVDTTKWASFFAQAVITLGTPTVMVIPDMAGVSGITNALIVADVADFAIDIDNEIVTRILPRFRRGMQDINAVVSSAFPLGEAVIDAFRNNEVAKHDSALRLKAAETNANILLEVGKINLSKDIEVAKFNILQEEGIKRLYLEATDHMLKLMFQRIGWEETFSKISIEANRIKIVALKEQVDQDAHIDEADAKWDLEVFSHGGNLMAAIGGGTAIPNLSGKNKVASVLGGAISGAAAGAMMATPGGPPTMLIGGVLGAAAGLLG